MTVSLCNRKESKILSLNILFFTHMIQTKNSTASLQKILHLSGQQYTLMTYKIKHCHYVSHLGLATEISILDPLQMHQVA